MTRKSKRKRDIKAIAGELGIGHRGAANVLDKREAEKPPCHSCGGDGLSRSTPHECRHCRGSGKEP